MALFPLATLLSFALCFADRVTLAKKNDAPPVYESSQMLIDPTLFPYGPPVARLETPILTPDTEDEQNGQVGNVLFSEGLVPFKGQWLMYFGEDDTSLGVASSPVQP